MLHGTYVILTHCNMMDGTHNVILTHCNMMDGTHNVKSHRLFTASLLPYSLSETSQWYVHFLPFFNNFKL